MPKKNSSKRMSKILSKKFISNTSDTYTKQTSTFAHKQAKFTCKKCDCAAELLSELVVLGLPPQSESFGAGRHPHLEEHPQQMSRAHYWRPVGIHKPHT